MRYAVYQLRKHPNYSHLHAVSAGPTAERMIFDGSSKSSNWVPLPVKLVGNELPPAELSTIFGPSALVVSESARHQLATIFDAGRYEFLSLDCDGHQFYIVNVMEIVDCLRADKANLQLPNPKYDFNPSRFGPSIFKIPQDPSGPILIVEDAKNLEKSFVYQVKMLRIPGLRFDLIWEGNDKRQLTDKKPICQPKTEVPVPEVPRIVRVSRSEVVICWNKLPGIDTYTVQWSKDNHSGFVTVGTAQMDDAQGIEVGAIGVGAIEVVYVDLHPEPGRCFYRVISHGEGRNRSKSSTAVEVAVGNQN